jgi:arabinofuranosyltransferase
MHYIDNCALSDPLLARLPAKVTPHWRIGHFYRQLPTNYKESIEQGKNLIVDFKTVRYWESIRTVTRGALFDKNRFLEIFRLNFNLVEKPDWEMYRTKNIPRSTAIPVVAESNIKLIRGHFTPWNNPGNVVFNSGLDITLTKEMDVLSTDISVDNNDVYEVAGLENHEWIQLATIRPTYTSGLVRHRMILKNTVCNVEKIRVTAKSGEGVYSIGHLLVNTQ